MTIVGAVLSTVLWLFFLALLARLVFDWVFVLSRSWEPKGLMVLVLEATYSVTDPPLKALRRVIPPLRIGSVSLDLGFLILIGLLSENFGQAHFIVSVGFFASFPFAMWIVGFGMLRFKHLRWFSLLSVILPFISIIMWGGWYGGLFPFWTGNAIPEITTALTGIFWLWLIWILHGTDNLKQVMSEPVLA